MRQMYCNLSAAVLLGTQIWKNKTGKTSKRKSFKNKLEKVSSVHISNIYYMLMIYVKYIIFSELQCWWAPKYGKIRPGKHRKERVSKTN